MHQVVVWDSKIAGQGKQCPLSYKRRTGIKSCVSGKVKVVFLLRCFALPSLDHCVLRAVSLPQATPSFALSDGSSKGMRSHKMLSWQWRANDDLFLFFSHSVSFLLSKIDIFGGTFALVQCTAAECIPMEPGTLTDASPPLMSAYASRQAHTAKVKISGVSWENHEDNDNGDDVVWRSMKITRQWRLACCTSSR